SRPGRKLAHSAVALTELLDFPRDVPGACALLLDTASAPPQDAPAVVPLPATRVAVLRYAWSRKADTVPGLLRALEESSQTREATALKDIVPFAGASVQKSEGVSTWEHNLKDLPALAEFVISRKP